MCFVSLSQILLKYSVTRSLTTPLHVRFPSSFPSSHPSSSQVSPPISPKIERRSESPDSRSTSSKKRTVECFPIAEITVSNMTQVSSQVPLRTRLDTLPMRVHRSNPGSTPRSTDHPSRLTKASPSNSQQALSRQLLAEKAHQINLLSSQQEAVILELITLSEQLESANAVCETAEVPYVDADDAGTLVLTSRTIEFPLESEPQIRRRPRKSHLMLATTGAVWQGTWGLLSALSKVVSFMLSPLGLLLPKPSRAYRGTVHPSGRRASGRRALERRTTDEFTLQEAAILVLGSAMLRVGLDLLVASYPMLWIPSLIVMLTPAAIAIYRSTLAPQTGFIWGYRLFSLMIGLLLGGRL